MKKIITLLTLIGFVFSLVTPPCGWAEPLTAMGLMPTPGTPVALSSGYTPAHLAGMVINAEDPFKFDFIFHRGDDQLDDQAKKDEYTKLVKYFLAALAVPDVEQWVNLSPNEKDRIIPTNFGKTEMGRDLLAQDYLLKQIAASLSNPDTELGKKYWDELHERAKELGKTDVKFNTFHKIWVVPQKAVIYEKDYTVLVVESHLKVMMEQDYLSMKKDGVVKTDGEEDPATRISSEVMREIMIPVIEKEVNEGKNFAPVRQVFSAMLLATWYKRAQKESILGGVYANQGKIEGIDQDPKTNQEIYDRYVEAYQKGVFNMVREDYDPETQEVIPREYFSGGMLNGFDGAMTTEKNPERLPGKQDDYEVAGVQMADPVSGPIKTVWQKIKSKAVKAVNGLMLAAAVVSGANNANAASVTVAWDANTEPDLAGYKVAYGTSSGNWVNVLDVGKSTTATISNLVGGDSYFIVAMAYNTSGLSSAPSPEISYTVPLQINTNQPPVVTANPATQTFSWTMSANPNVTGYVVYYGASPSQLFNRINIGKTDHYSPTNLQTATYFFGFAEEVTGNSESGKTIKVMRVTRPNNPLVEFRITGLRPSTNHPNNFALTFTYDPRDTNILQNGVDVVGSKDPGSPSYTLSFGRIGPDKLKNTTNYEFLIPFQALSDLPSVNFKIKSGGVNPAMLATPEADQAMTQVTPSIEQNVKKEEVGGIDFAESNLDLEIKRDGKGMVLPFDKQDLENFHIDGLVPMILDIKPAVNLPLFSSSESKSGTDLTET